MRSPELFLRSLRRSLVPPLDVRKLAFRGGWAGLPIYVVLILIYPASLAQAGWVDLNAQFTYIALAGALIGTLVGIELLFCGWSWVMLGLIVKAAGPESQPRDLNASASVPAGTP